MENRVEVIGRLGKKPELKESNGKKYCRLSIATDESYKDRQGVMQERTEWHNFTVFDRQAENCAKYLDKGSLVRAIGALFTRKRQENGADVYSLEVRVRNVQFMDRKASQGQQEEEYYPETSGDVPF